MKPDRAIVGAIRWDAWHGDKGVPGRAVQRALGPKEWRYRLPFFGREVGENEVKIEATAETMEQEITYARHAGLDYWAFVYYFPGDPMREGLELYLSNRKVHQINFCLIVEAGRWGSRQDHLQRIEVLAELFAKPTYQLVLGDRPLFYLGFIRDDWLESAWGGDLNELRRSIEVFRERVQRTGRGNPYIVIMDFNARRGDKLRRALGCDALSAYALQANGEGEPFASLARYAAGFWDACRETGSPVVPLVMSGWDRRPRVIHPVPWEPYQKPNVGLEKYYEAPTPRELAAHLQDALEWVERWPDAANSRAVLIYAWNEHDEGGWLVPTWGDGTSRVDALRSVLVTAGGKQAAGSNWMQPDATR